MFTSSWIIGVSLFVVFIVVPALYCLEIALRGHDAEAERRKNWIWRPPFARGGALLDWAAATTRRMVGEGLSGRRSAATPVKLAADLERGATRAMLPLASEQQAGCPVRCPDEGQGMIGVTAPEVLQVADTIRRTMSRAEKQRIYDQALANSQKISGLDHTQFNGTEAPCPLAGHDHLCRVYAARPLHCRPLHAAAIAAKFDLEIDRAGPADAILAQTVRQGVAAGLESGLQSAGLDARLYELNSALVTALDTPDAAVRWANGEDVFAGCKQYQ